MKTKRPSVARKAGSRKAATSGKSILPIGESVGYQIRMAHRALQRYLQVQIEPHGITLGMWYYLRTLWDEDGLTQRELSRRIETMEPSTLSAIQLMERAGLVRRVRNQEDRRKIHVFLTPKGRSLKAKLLPLAREVVDVATATLKRDEVRLMLRAIMEVRKNINAELSKIEDREI